MSRSWKRLSEFAENVNFGDADMCAVALVALERTWRKDVPGALMAGVCKVFLEPQSGLFAEQRIEEIEALSCLAAGYGVGRLLIDYASMIVQEGRVGEAGLIEATQQALSACGTRASRQIDEHYLRKASATLTQQVRERVGQALSAADRRALARLLCGLDAGATRRSSLKQKGVEDGVPLW